MHSDDYIRKLRRLLRDLPAEEREDAIAYYEEYFAEAGPDKAREVMDRLGPPKTVAAGIRADHAMRSMEQDGKPRMKKGIFAVWLTVLGIFAMPIALPLAVAIFSLALTALVVVAVLILSVFLVAISVIGAGLISAVSGAVIALQSISSGIFYGGMGLAAVGAGLLLFIFALWLSRISIRGFARLVNRIRLKKSHRAPSVQNVEEVGTHA